MIKQIGRYKVERGSSDKVQKLCPLCLEDITKSKDHKCLTKMSIVVKKPDYGLIKVPKSEPLVKRMLSLTNNHNDDSKQFIVLYVNNTFIGYKSKNKTKFLPKFSKKEYIKVLEDYPFSKKRVNVKKAYKTVKRI